MGKLILVRHGESEGNATRTFTTSGDAAITALGREQARGAAGKIKERFRPTVIVSSPFFRARETARIIGELLGLSVEIENDLREQSLGQLAGKSYDLIRADPSFDPAAPWKWRPPGGESLLDVYERTSTVLDRIARRHGQAEVVIVSHGGVMRALWAHVNGGWGDARVSGNCGIVLVEHNEGVYVPPPQILDEGGRGVVVESGG